MIDYISDIEQGKKERVLDDISRDVHKAIVATYRKYAAKNSFSEAAPVNCPDLPGICGFDENKFLELAKGQIPELDLNKYDDKYKILDFVQLCYSHVKKANRDVRVPYIHGLTGDEKFAQSYTFDESNEEKENFKNDINAIFRRNGLVFELQETGKIERTVPLGLVPLVSKLYSTKDTELNTLVEEAFERFIQSRFEDRKIALEKIWDAYERMKTYYQDMDKKESITELIQKVSNNDEPYKKLLDTESDALMKIGNDFRIRHHETNKHNIINNNQVDYFFYRMVSFMALFLKYLEDENK